LDIKGLIIASRAPVLRFTSDRDINKNVFILTSSECEFVVAFESAPSLEKLSEQVGRDVSGFFLYRFPALLEGEFKCLNDAGFVAVILYWHQDKIFELQLRFFEVG